MKSLIARWREKAHRLEVETFALYLVYRDPRTPWYARVWALLVVAYALSPIDLIPDFIPVLGYLDDLVLVPAGIALALRMIPRGVMDEARRRANQAMGPGRSVNRLGAAIVILVWLVVLALVALSITNFLRRTRSQGFLRVSHPVL